MPADLSHASDMKMRTNHVQWIVIGNVAAMNDFKAWYQF
jgi:hypothetical protein